MDPRIGKPGKVIDQERASGCVAQLEEWKSQPLGGLDERADRIIDLIEPLQKEFHVVGERPSVGWSTHYGVGFFNSRPADGRLP